MDRRSLTRKDVAEAAGVSVTTVSDALTGKARVAASTREHVLKVSARLGYRPNVAASLLASQKSMGGSSLLVASISDRPYEGRCFNLLSEALGLSGLRVHDSEFRSPRQMLDVLYARGVHGLLVKFRHWPWTKEETLQAGWERFSVVKINRTFESMAFHLVRHSPFDYMHRTLQRVLSHGYERVAVLLPELYQYETDDWARLGAVAAAVESYKDRQIFWRYSKQMDSNRVDPELMDWLNKHQPDALIVFHFSEIVSLVKAGLRIPGDFFAAAVISVDKPIDGFRISGNDGAEEELLQRGLSMLKELIGRGERGLPALPVEHVVEPRWLEGDTLPG